MNIFKKILYIPYKVFRLIRERFFLVSTEETALEEDNERKEEYLHYSEERKKYTSLHSQDEESEPEEEIGEVYEVPDSFSGQHVSLCETLDRVLNTGVVIHGDITISVANIDLIYIGLKALVSSVETAKKVGAKIDGNIPDFS